MAKSVKVQSKSSKIIQTLIYIFLILLAVVYLLPLLWVLYVSIKDDKTLPYPEELVENFERIDECPFEENPTEIVEEVVEEKTVLSQESSTEKEKEENVADDEEMNAEILKLFGDYLQQGGNDS